MLGTVLSISTSVWCSMTSAVLNFESACHQRAIDTLISLALLLWARPFCNTSVHAVLPHAMFITNASLSMHRYSWGLLYICLEADFDMREVSCNEVFLLLCLNIKADFDAREVFSNSLELLCYSRVRLWKNGSALLQHVYSATLKVSSKVDFDVKISSLKFSRIALLQHSATMKVSARCVGKEISAELRNEPLFCEHVEPGACPHVTNGTCTQWIRPRSRGPLLLCVETGPCPHITDGALPARSGAVPTTVAESFRTLYI